jgi:hypothetical protein
MPVLGWPASGWALALGASVGTGVWAAAKHGSHGTGFLAAVLGGIAVRAVVLLAGLAAALRAGGTARWLYLAGFAAGLVPQWLYEIGWFHRRGRALALSAPSGDR